MSEVEKAAVAETAVETETGGRGPTRQLAGAIGRSIVSFLLTIITPLKDGNFRLYFGGQMLSTLGDTFYTVALPWIILNNGGNAQELGIVLAAYGVPRLATILVGGMLSDRVRPRPVMLPADVARALLLGLMAFLSPPPLRSCPISWQKTLCRRPTR